MRGRKEESASGMSRAAKKRAKKKQNEARKRIASEIVSTSVDSTEHHEQEPDTKKPKAIANLNMEEEDDESIEEVVDDDDSTVGRESDVQKGEGKRTGKGTTAAEKAYSSVKMPPASVTNIRQILLEGSDNDTAVLEMTSKDRANCALNFLLQPSGITSEDFYAEYWEKKPLLVKRRDGSGGDMIYQNRFGNIMSLQGIRDLSKNKTLYYGKDLNVTRYERTSDGVKRRRNLDLIPSNNGKEHEDDYVMVEEELLWSHYGKGATIRLLCPHRHFDSVFSLLSLLELEFGCMVGANSYLTPPRKSQGFAPHYDDIEAFCLQIEGQKRWKVYAPLNKAEELPRVSSNDFTDDDLRESQPVIDTVLQPGDLLYMPRGWIHQAITLQDDSGSDKHSLHLTISVSQQWAWADFLELLLPDALNSAINSDKSTSLREGLPRCFLDYMGAAHNNEDMPDALAAAFLARKGEDSSDEDEIEKKIAKLREEFRTQCKKKMMRVVREANAMIDAVCDEMGLRFLSDRLPIAFTKEEEKLTGKSSDSATDILPNTLCRLVRPGVARLVLEDGKAVVYHCCDNSKVFHQNPLSPLEYEMDDAAAIEQLFTTVEPHWIMVNDLLHDSIEDKISLTKSLFDEGILAVMEPISR